MAFNNGFPMGYQPYYSQQPSIAQPQQNNGIIWVQGEAGAKSYLVAPNTTVQLWDSESQVIYLKSADASGMPSMKVIDYTIRNASPQHVSVDSHVDYATKEDIGALQNELNKLRDEVKNITNKEELAHE